jgi:predicted O-methyltransferase YrrM
MERKPKVIVDLGVWKGMSTITLARAQEKACANGYVLAIDTFLGSPEHWNRARTDVTAALKFAHGMPHFYETFLSNMLLSGVADRVLPIAQTSENAVSILQRLGVVPDLVHLDATQEYAPTLRDIRMYYGLLADGGVLIGDDFNWPSVARAVIHFTDEMRLEFSVESPKWIVTKPRN